MKAKTEERIGNPLALLIMYSIFFGAAITSLAYKKYCLDIQHKETLVGVNDLSLLVNEFPLLLIITFLLYSAIKKGDRLLRYAYLIGTLPLILQSSFFPEGLWVSVLQIAFIFIVNISLMTYIIRIFECRESSPNSGCSESEKSGPE